MTRYYCNKCVLSVGLNLELQELHKQLQLEREEKKRLVVTHRKEVIGLRQQLTDLQILKKGEARKIKEKESEVEKERVKRKKAEQRLKELQSQQVSGESDEERERRRRLAEKKREDFLKKNEEEKERKQRRQLAEKKKEDFLKKKEAREEESKRVRTREVLDEDEWYQQRGVIVQKTPSKRARIEDLKGKEEVGKQKEQSKSGRLPEENNVAVKSTGVKF
jgi:hypothetical protein